ncbi:type II toxin-antitoxin system RelE/ParE family toxin [Sphingomonas sp. LT1P40]|uniref:type II toxin-antitoxin system RelE/ParE family toxin n=1 Tax=Alteristakelama amylovorans TaxID=3096166 RepID=UPI002FCC1E38
MTRLQTVVELPEFIRRAKAIMTDDERIAIVNHVAGNPESGVSLGGGLRKIRIPRIGGGKSGGYRTIYVFGDTHMPIFLVTVFAKNEKDNLSKTEQATAVALEQVADCSLWRPGMTAYDSIAKGLNEALDYARGKETGARVHAVEVPEVDVAAIRASTGLSQSAFANSIGVAKGTLLNWEHGRRRPTGPAQVLLAMIAKKPSLVSELLR